MKFSELIAKLQAGTVTEGDLEGVTADDAIKARREAGGGLLRANIEDAGALLDLVEHTSGEASFGEGVVEYAGEKKRPDDGTVSYVMVSDALIPPFNDRVKSTAWDLSEFRYRGAPLLYGHNLERELPPIGRMRNVKKGVEMKRGSRSFRALTGDAEFTGEEDFPFASMIARLVRKGVLRGGSVGFDVVKARPASEEEQEEFGMRSFSSVIEKASLFEFSVVALGRDANAQRLGKDVLAPVEGELAAWARAGVYDENAIAHARHYFQASAAERTRPQIVVPELTVTEPAESAAPAPVSLAFDAPTTTGTVFPFTLDGNPPPITLTSGPPVSKAEIDSLREQLTRIERDVAGMRQRFESQSKPETDTNEDEAAEPDEYEVAFGLDDMDVEAFARTLSTD